MHSTFVLLSIAFLPIALGNASLIYDSHVCIHSALVLVPAQVQTNLLREESRDGQAQKESNQEDHQEEGEEKEEEVAQVYLPAEVPPPRGTRTNGFPFPLPKFLVRQSGWFLPSQHQRKQALRLSSVRPFVLYTLRHTFLTRLGGRGCDALVLPATPPWRSVAGPGKARCQPPAHARSQSRTLLYLLVDRLGSFSALTARTPVRECEHPVRHRPARETVSLDGGSLVRFRGFAFVERECVVSTAAFTLENIGWHPCSNSLVSCRNTAPKAVGVSRWKAQRAATG